MQGGAEIDRSLLSFYTYSDFLADYRVTHCRCFSVSSSTGPCRDFVRVFPILCTGNVYVHNISCCIVSSVKPKRREE